jgi:ribosome-associated heat shock protein Hsp15
MSDPGTVRIDKWLWAARFFKTRSLAAQAVEAGRVRVERCNVKPARAVRPGETLQIERGNERIEVVVSALSEARGPAPVAQRLYQETPASAERRIRAAEARRLSPEPAASIRGRPTKRDSRRLQRWLNPAAKGSR